MAWLLDTQIMLWLEEEPKRLPAGLADKIYAEAYVYFSQVSVWELAIKLKTGKLTLSVPLPAFVTNFRKDFRFRQLDIRLPHIYHTQDLPLHHRDPFDRLLIAQSITENLPVVSSDGLWDAYGVNRIWS